MPSFEAGSYLLDIGLIRVGLQERPSMTAQEVSEFAELRSTIRQRGTQRLWVFLVTLVAWAGATIATAALAALPVATLLPLLLLAGGFEAVFQLHTGVERIGRYLQVFYDDGEAPQGSRNWERTAMAYGRAFPGGSDALLTPYFLLATVLNYVPVLFADPLRIELTVVGAVHLVFIARLLLARHQAGKQRALDLERFERIKQENRTAATPK